VTSLELELCAFGLLVASGALALLLVRRPGLATMVACVGAAVACVVGLGAAIDALRTGFEAQLALAWHVPAGALVVGLDPLSSFFLVPVFALGGLAAVYGRTYLASRPDARVAVRAGAAFNLLIAALVMVLLARQAIVFLVAWEIMTLLAFLLVSLDHHDVDVRRAGWTYLIASHVAMMALFALFVSMGQEVGGALDFVALARATTVSPQLATWFFVLALLGFGIKAGVVGLHVWLPEAHAAAPSHVSALMSGVLVKMGVYGLLRIILMLPPVAAYGTVLMALGLTGAVVGIALALYQRDLKRVLAYSTVENVGIVWLGLGLGLWARAYGEATLSALGFAGALLHVWNHAAMKGLMFLGAGSVLHGAGSKDLEHLGGLLRRMRWTGAAMIFGSVAIAALPPLNGFVSEWLLYRGLALTGLRHPGSAGLAALVGVAVLALVGGLAALCFVRLVGVGLLGQPRSEAAAHAHEPGRGMTVPLGVLVAVCLALALAPHQFIVLFAPVLNRLTGDAGAGSVARAAGALGPVVAVNLALIVVLVLAGTLVARRIRGAAVDDTWGCAYEAPGPRLQYTARSFSELLAEHLLPRALRARLRVAAPKGPFPSTAELASDAVDPLTRAAYEPIVARFADRFARFHWLQRGSLHIYLMYIVAVTIGALLWSAARDAGWGR